MSLSASLEQLHEKKVKLEDELQSIWKEERTLKEEVKVLKEKLAVQELEERLRKGHLPLLRGEKAIEAIHDFMHDLKERRNEELTEKQMNALTKLTNGLILCIEAEKPQTKTPLTWNVSPEHIRSLYLS